MLQIKSLNIKTANLYDKELQDHINLFACIDRDIILTPNSTCVINTGISIAVLDDNIQGMVIPNHELAKDHYIILSNGIELIRSCNDEILIHLFNNSKATYIIKPLSKIASIVFTPIVKLKVEMVDILGKQSIKKVSKSEAKI